MKVQRADWQVALVLALIVAGSMTYTWSQYLGFEIYETQTHAWQVDLGDINVGAIRTFYFTVECKESTGRFLVTYSIEIQGPGSLVNDYLRIWWKDTDGASFTLGDDGDQTFNGIGTLSWNSAQLHFDALHKNNVSLAITFLTTAALGEYNAKVWVAFAEEPVVRVSLSTRVLNTKSEGIPVLAYTYLEAPYKEEDIEVESVRLWFEDSYVLASRGRLTGGFLIVEFSRGLVVEMLSGVKGLVKLSVVGLVDGVEFRGNGTIYVTSP